MNRNAVLVLTVFTFQFCPTNSKKREQTWSSLISTMSYQVKLPW